MSSPRRANASWPARRPCEVAFRREPEHQARRSSSGRYPGSAHVEHLLGRGHSDDDVWEHARVNGFAIASKDNDFRQRAFLSGPPPKVVWLSVGNAGTDEIAALLRSHADALGRFEANPEEALLVIEAI